ncbi:hypothetical protein [Streptomyces sp. NPDC058861]|uniref:hypothetical protein n=1 Tax=Streptomyces sp. NPDC058861 TaxID=3346653 RepID=UPI0036BE7AF5
MAVSAESFGLAGLGHGSEAITAATGRPVGVVRHLIAPHGLRPGNLPPAAP